MTVNAKCFGRDVPRTISVAELAASIDRAALVSVLNNMLSIAGTLFVRGVICSDVDVDIDEDGKMHKGIFISDTANPTKKFRLWVKNEDILASSIQNGQSVYAVGTLFAWHSSKKDLCGFSLNVDSIEIAKEECPSGNSILYAGFLSEKITRLELENRELKNRIDLSMNNLKGQPNSSESTAKPQ